MNELERELFALLSAEEYGTKIRKAGVYPVSYTHLTLPTNSA